MLARTAALRTARTATRTAAPAPRSIPTARLPLLRHASSSPYYPPPGQQQRGIKVGHLFTALALLGVSATSYGLYQFYSTFTTFPDTTTHPIRSHLRSALRSISTASYPRASTSFAQAYELALDLSSKGELGGREAALMKTTGIAVRWGGMWEEAGEFANAREVYDRAFHEVIALHSLEGRGTKEEVMRGVAIALKVGDLWVEEGKVGDEKAEPYFVWAVEEMMRLGMTDVQKTAVGEEMLHGMPAPRAALEEGVEARDPGLDLPVWLGKVELVAAFERLGELYARAGKIDYAQPLLLQAIATLLPPSPKDGPKIPTPPIATRCHAATLMNNLSSALVQSPSPTAANIDQASRWARQALTVAAQCRQEGDLNRKGVQVALADREEVECEMVAVVGTYNLGKLSELAGNKVSAKTWFEKSRTQAGRLGLREGVTRSTEAIRRLEGE